MPEARERLPAAPHRTNRLVLLHLPASCLAFKLERGRRDGHNPSRAKEQCMPAADPLRSIRIERSSTQKGRTQASRHGRQRPLVRAPLSEPSLVRACGLTETTQAPEATPP